MVSGRKRPQELSLSYLNKQENKTSVYGESRINELPHLYVIEVKGSIISEEGNQYAQGWAAGSVGGANKTIWEKERYDDVTHSFNSDLRLNRKCRAVPYAYYVAYGDAGIRESSSVYADLSCCEGYSPAFLYLEEYLKEIEGVFSEDIPASVKEVCYNGLYVSTFSVLELFLCDFLLCGIFSDGGNYKRAVSHFCEKDTMTAIEIENRIKKTITRLVFHRFDKIRDLYWEVLIISFPDTENLNRLIYKRHNIVHRYALSNIDRMTVCDACEEDIICLIQEIKAFSTSLWGRVQSIKNEECRCHRRR